MKSFPTAFSLVIWCLFSPALQSNEYGLESKPPAGSFLNSKLPQLQPGPTGSWTTVNAFPKLPLADPTDSSFAFEPVYLTGAPRSTQLYVCDKKGKIWTFANDPNVAEKSLFLDISKQVKVTPNASMGGIVFHPDFGLAGSPNRGYIYTHYFWSPDPKQLGPKNQAADWQDEYPLSGYWRLSRFTVPDGANAVDPESEFILIQQYDAHHWHNGGSMFFDKQGFLYLTSGDIGADKNYYKAGQTLKEGLFGTVLRIDVDKDETRSHPIRRQPTDHDKARWTKPKSWKEKSYSQGYYIPNDNPWQSEAGDILEEFWCIGIRSPHRMSYDPITEQIWVGDVGQFRKEELNLIVKGGNYQWPYKDGTLTGFAGKPSPLIGTDQPPAYEYTHTSAGAAVVGGYIYRGFQHRADLEGKYLFAEHQGGQVWTLTQNSDGSPPKVERLTTIKGSGFHNGPSSFGQDNNGELYITVLKRNSSGKNINGNIVKLARTESTTNPEAPSLLSETGIYSDITIRTPADTVVPYVPAAQFWSDGAVKSRYMAIPDGQQIAYSASENWSFPKGSVFVKHFDYPVNDTDSTITKPIETRFMIHGSDGRYFGLSYRWNEEGTDAYLIPDRASAEIEIATADGGTRYANWDFPSRGECMHCHTERSGYVLGVRTHQLNCDFSYPKDVTANQLKTLDHIGLLGGDFTEVSIPNLLTAHAIDDQSAPLADRVRSYLDSNCSQCHQPGGVYAGFDARYTTPLEKQGIINGPLIRNYGVEGQTVIRPRNLEKSILHRRLHSLGDEKMPPLAKNKVDTEAERILSEWIHSLDPEKWNAPTEATAESGPPAARSDIAKVWQGGKISIDVLSNDLDFDEDLDPSSIEIVTNSTQGKAVFDAVSKTIQYTHTGTGSDSFSYRVSDLNSTKSNLAKVEIEIRPIEEFDLPKKTVSNVAPKRQLPAEPLAPTPQQEVINNQEVLPLEASIDHPTQHLPFPLLLAAPLGVILVTILIFKMQG